VASALLKRFVLSSIGISQRTSAVIVTLYICIAVCVCV